MKECVENDTWNGDENILVKKFLREKMTQNYRTRKDTFVTLSLFNTFLAMYVYQKIKIDRDYDNSLRH